MLCSRLLRAMAKRCEEYSKDSLDDEAKVRYEKKLQLIGLDIYLSLQAIFGSIDDVTLWPPVEFSDIVVDLLQTCYYRKINSEFCVLKVAVRRSQRLSEKLHRPWVGLRQKDGSICAAHCTCMI